MLNRSYRTLANDDFHFQLVIRDLSMINLQIISRKTKPSLFDNGDYRIRISSNSGHLLKIGDPFHLFQEGFKLLF